VPDIPIDELIRSHRKTIGLQITNDARLIVRAPFFASRDIIHKLVRQKGPWIKAKHDYFKQRQAKTPIRVFAPGEKLLLEKQYKARALEYITKRANDYAQITGLKYQRIRVNCAKTRWGSCGHKNTLNFTWRLIMAPPRVVDYVIAHELTHLKQKDHSHRFWEEVAKIIPDYRQDEQWLKQNGYLLAWPK